VTGRGGRRSARRRRDAGGGDFLRSGFTLANRRRRWHTGRRRRKGAGRDAGWRQRAGEEGTVRRRLGQHAGLEEVALYSHTGLGVRGAHAEAKDRRQRDHVVSMMDYSAGPGWAPAGSRLGRREWIRLRSGRKIGWAERKRAG
jgi:hypothetical protein